MVKSIGRWLALAGVLLAWTAGGRSPAASAAGGVGFTVTVQSAFLREQPSYSARRAYSVFEGQRYAVEGRTQDSAWLLLSFAGAANHATWIPAVYGQIDGNLDWAPVAAPVIAPTAAPATAALAPGAAGTTPSVRYTVAVKSLFGRSAPSADAARVVSLFRGQTYAATAQSEDGLWLRLSLAGGGEAWVARAHGALTGSAAALPVSSGAPAPAPTAAAPPAGAGVGLPAVSDAARAIYQRGLSLGNNPRAFSKIGDCNSVGPYFLAPFDRGEYRLGGLYAYLQPTIDHFAGSFGRDGMAARDGMNAGSVFDTLWADPRLCERGETPLACEARLNRPSLAIISLGTNGYWQTDQEYETNLRRILDDLIERGVLPILSTKADNLEGGDRFNQIVARLAGEYNVPLWDFARAARGLPGSGLVDAYHLSWGQAFYDTSPAPLLGWQLRNLTALQALEAVWRGAR